MDKEIDEFGDTMFTQEDKDYINKQKLGEPMEPQEESWTSVDAYYKGFHIKKSWGKNVSRVILMADIDDLIKAGFTPSWNQETNKAMATPVPTGVPVVAPKPQEPVLSGEYDDEATCPVHNAQMTQKDGQYGPFWSHANGKDTNGKTIWCNGRKTKYNGYQK